MTRSIKLNTRCTRNSRVSERLFARLEGIVGFLEFSENLRMRLLNDFEKLLGMIVAIVPEIQFVLSDFLSRSSDHLSFRRRNGDQSSVEGRGPEI